MPKILDGQQGKLVPGKLSVLEQSPFDVPSRTRGSIQTQLYWEKGSVQKEGVTFAQGQNPLFS